MPLWGLRVAAGLFTPEATLMGFVGSNLPIHKGSPPHPMELVVSYRPVTTLSEGHLLWGLWVATFLCKPDGHLHGISWVASGLFIS